MKNVILVHFINFFGSTQWPKLYLTCIPAPSSLSSYERPITKIAKPYSGENHFFQFQIHRADRVIFVPKKLTEPCILIVTPASRTVRSGSADSPPGITQIFIWMDVWLTCHSSLPHFVQRRAIALRFVTSHLIWTAARIVPHRHNFPPQPYFIF